MRKLNVLFTINGDGRGHMTQALAMQKILHDAGHRVPAMLVGREPNQPIPGFFPSKAAVPIIRFDSFAFVADPQNKSISLPATVWHNLRDAPRFIQSFGAIRRALRQYRPDVVLNFFEPIAGIYYLLYRPRAALVSLANQYIMLHPDYSFPPGKRLDRLFVQLWSRVTSFRSRRLLALSLKPRANLSRMTVIPPLLRPEVLARAPQTREPFLLIYLLKSGLRDEIVHWHQQHPEVELHCFTDLPQAEETLAYDETLYFHRLSETAFLDLMARCNGIVATAGYQTLCEAMYLGKPILVVPVANHYEQFCNAFECPAIGAGLGAAHFDLSAFLEYLPKHKPAPFREWVAQAPQRIVQAIESVDQGLPSLGFDRKE
ncbi:MAG TPA: glycosyltransferase family protein [Gemmataceae bacterium]|nr:glycosyltransferase family protein [Gemmataceae bacterium]